MTTSQLYRQRLALAVHSVKYKGVTATDKNIATLLGILSLLPGLKTTGSCGGHAEINPKWPDCSQRKGHWFVSFRGPFESLLVLEQFAKTVPNVRFAEGPKDKYPACGVCESKGCKPWWGLWGKGDPRRVAAQLQRFLRNYMVGSAAA
jgi:hypothetical protein